MAAAFAWSNIFRRSAVQRGGELGIGTAFVGAGATRLLIVSGNAGASRVYGDARL